MRGLIIGLSLHTHPTVIIGLSLHTLPTIFVKTRFVQSISVVDEDRARAITRGSSASTDLCRPIGKFRVVSHQHLEAIGQCVGVQLAGYGSLSAAGYRATAELEKLFESWGGGRGTRPWGTRGKGSPGVSEGPKPPIQLLQLLKNSSKEVKRAQFVILCPPGPTQEMELMGPGGEGLSRSLPPGFSSHALLPPTADDIR